MNIKVNVAFFILCLISITPLSACLFLNMTDFLFLKMADRSLSDESIEAYIRAGLPPSASDLHHAYFAGQDTFILIKFTMNSDQDQLYNFVQELGFSGEMEEGMHLYYISPYHNASTYRDNDGLTWWTPDQAISPIGIKFTSEGVDYRILVDTSNNYIVYLIVEKQ
jgi:hypothetical protein